MKCELPNHHCVLCIRTYVHTYIHFCCMNERTSVFVSMLYVSHVGVYREWYCLCIATICSMMECKITFVSVNARVLQQIRREKSVHTYVCIHARPTICVSCCVFLLVVCRDVSIVINYDMAKTIEGTQIEAMCVRACVCKCV